MNLDELKKRINKPTSREWQGETIWLRKLGAQDAIPLVAKMRELSSQQLEAADDHQKTTEIHAGVLSKTLCNETGDLELDSEEGVSALKQMNFADLVELGTISLNNSGFGGDTKKNSPKNNMPPTDSADCLDSGPTPTTSPPT